MELQLLLTILSVICIAFTFSSEIAVKLKTCTDEFADQIAKKYGFINKGRIINCYYSFEIPSGNSRSGRDASPAEVGGEEILWFEPQEPLIRVKKAILPRLTDPLYKNQWHMAPDNKMGITKAWNLGYTGSGVVVAVVDDGIQFNHTDLRPNYDAANSWDAASHDPYPWPHYSNVFGSIRMDYHGTRCAGQISAVANNGKCGVGVAYDSKVSGIRVLGSETTDKIEAVGLSYNHDDIDIYSSSWGPSDNGYDYDGPRTITREALKLGARLGRKGKGNIFVWAAGNGGDSADSCSMDGYVTDIHTIAVTAVTASNDKPYYTEKCPGIVVSTYSSGAYRGITTTDVHDSCTDGHSGTSASAPIAAGVAALALESNPRLGWRDMQDLFIRSANNAPLQQHEGWFTNGAGLMYNNAFGFGVIDAEKMVTMARAHTLLSKHLNCTHEYRPTNGMYLSGSFKHSMTVNVADCNGMNSLEHVQVYVRLSYYRGDLEIWLTSPMGTRVQLLAERPRDNLYSDMGTYPLLSMANWGENPNGDWILTIENKGSVTNTGILFFWNVILYGHTRAPETTTTPAPTTTSTKTPTTTTVATTPTPSTAAPSTKKIIEAVEVAPGGQEGSITAESTAASSTFPKSSTQKIIEHLPEAPGSSGVVILENIDEVLSTVQTVPQPEQNQFVSSFLQKFWGNLSGYFKDILLKNKLRSGSRPPHHH